MLSRDLAGSPCTPLSPVATAHGQPGGCLPSHGNRTTGPPRRGGRAFPQKERTFSWASRARATPLEDHFLRVRDGYSQKMDSTWAVAPPHPALRGMVQPYIGYVTSTKAPEFHLGLPSPAVAVVPTPDPPLALLGNEGGRDVRAGVGGLQLEPVVIDQRVLQRGVHVCVDPLAVHSLFGLPAAELFGTT